MIQSAQRKFSGASPPPAVGGDIPKCILRKTIGYHILRLVLILCVAWCLDADGFVGGGNAARAVLSLIQEAVVDPCGDKG